MYRIAYIALAVAACDNTPREAPIPRTPMVTLSGTIRLAGDVTKLPDAGGDVHLYVYSRSDEGYCLRREALFAQAVQIVRSPVRQDLVDGATYEVRFDEPPEQTYPVTLFVTAVWQNTRAAAHDCEVNTLAGGLETYNAFGAYGVNGAAIAEPETSACCHFVPQAIELKGAESVFENVDVTLSVRPGACVDPLARGDACFFRRAADGSDTACSVALGPSRDEVLIDRDRKVCQ